MTADTEKKSVDEVVAILRPFRQKYLDTIRHLECYAALFEELSVGFGNVYALKADYILKPGRFMLENMYGDIEEELRHQLGIFDIDEENDTVGKALLVFLEEESGEI